ncbi:G8 domain-containing protein [Seonamhaeicola sp.]|uniref:G8 domain-containing protein n=1 Tax=Seonamhaeicola sp. TaxID=1912245 RepID=UPI002626F275|nr:G8 domain-containing protein [Seonamhaeicola sp.]
MKLTHRLSLFLLAIVCSVVSQTYAQGPVQVAGTATKTAAQSGNWSDAATWGGSVPADDARVLIPNGITVTVNDIIPEKMKSIRIANGAKLQYATNVNTELRTEYLVSEMGGSFEIGNSTNKVAANVTARLIFAWRGGTTKSQDPSRFAPGAVLMGPVRMHGAEKTSWTTLAVHPTSGTSQLSLGTTPTGWRVGDELVVAGTDINDYRSDEKVSINSIAGSTVTLSAALTKNHQPPSQLTGMVDVHVSNNTRNVVISSENPSVAALSGTNGFGKPRGHMMFMHNPNVILKYIETENTGRTDKAIDLDDWSVPLEGEEGQPDPRWSTTVPYPAGPGMNPRGRYSIHFHRTLDTNTNKALVEGCVVNNDPGWAYTNHSSNVDFIENVSYEVVGSAYCTEAGDEVGNFLRNIAIRTYNPAEPLNLGRPAGGGLGVEAGRTNGLTDGREQISDFAHQGDGFWVHGTGVTIEGNVVSGCSGHAYIYWTEGLWESLRGRPQMQDNIDLYVDPVQFKDLNAEVKARAAQYSNWIFDVWYILPKPFKDNIGYTSAQGFRGDYIMTEFHEVGETTSIEFNMMPPNYRNTMNLVIENTLLWSIRRTGMQFENCAQITLKNNKVYGYGASTALAPWRPQPNPYPGLLEVEPHSIGLDLDQYHNTRSWTIENNIIAGWDGESQAVTLPINAEVVVNGGTFDNSGTDIFIREVNWAKDWLDRVVNNEEVTDPNNGTRMVIADPTPLDKTTPWRNITIQGNIVFNNPAKNIVLDAQMHLLNNAGDSFALLHPDGSGVKMTGYFLLPDNITLNFGPFNNAKVYFDEQAADFVPVPTTNLLDPLLYESEAKYPERLTPTVFRGKTNQQLQNLYGTSMGGVITPATAVSHAMITGGKVSNVTIEGCPIDALPSNNFSIIGNNETCVGRSNGEIIISSQQVGSYTATVNNNTQSFSSQHKITGLAPGTYTLCIAVPGATVNCERCYEVVIGAGISITGKSSIKNGPGSQGTVMTIDIDKGTAPFTVKVNNKNIGRFSSSKFDIAVSEQDQVEVTSSKQCEGKLAFTAKVLGGFKVFPNPVRSAFNVQVASSKSDKIHLEIYAITGSLVYQGDHSLVGSTARINSSSLKQGIYLVKVYADNKSKVFKIIKQ